MQDKNGTEIRTGDIVKVDNAYSKCDNGYWLVTRSPGDKGWSGKYHSLTKVGKNGKISYAKRNLSSWPICSYLNSRFKRMEVNAYNKENATIEVLAHIDIDNPLLFEKDNVDHIKYINWRANG